jgi:hypothetical protein
MPHIVSRYSFNVPKRKTIALAKYELANKGGECPRDCADCAAYKVSCDGCQNKFLCPDRACGGDNCSSCATMCHRAKDRVAEAVGFVGGFEIDCKTAIDEPINYGQELIPGINKRIGNKIESSIVSIPFYAIFDFCEEKPLCVDVKKHFKISENTKVIISFYMKDDKICTLFEYMVGEKFIRLLKQYSGVDYWHTPCFSVFDLSNYFDQVINFKRQFWAGDLMRDHGLKVIQECLYTGSNPHVSAKVEKVIEVIEKKGIKNIGINMQLSKTRDAEEVPPGYDICKLLPNDVTILATGISPAQGKWIADLHKLTTFCTYASQYNTKDRDYD